MILYTLNLNVSKPYCLEFINTLRTKTIILVINTLVGEELIVGVVTHERGSPLSSRHARNESDAWVAHPRYKYLTTNNS